MIGLALMNARDENTVPKRLREWWASPARSGVQRLIAPPEYRHLRAFGIIRVVGGILATAGVVCLAYAASGWAAFFLVIAALDLPAGWWELTIARSRNYTEASRPRS